MPDLTQQAPHVTTVARRQRGAIYIEALIVVVLLTILFATSLFLSGAYRAKLETFAGASAVAFQNAGKGCGALMGGTRSVDDLLAKAGAGTSDPGPAFLGGAVQAQSASSSLSIENSDVIGPKKSWTFASEFQVMCNERPVSKDDALTSLAVLDWAIAAVLHGAGF